ncbi:MAG: M48 family metallopeptidase [Pseudomonadales bacterium]|jgi:Zn-dependent protease with chaperone function|nr:M48 family metallopeptidase [Pseudomonadales bacterium]
MFRGHYGSGRDARVHGVDVTLEDGELVLHGAGIDVRAPIAELEVDAPLGELPLVLRLADGARVEILDGRAAFAALSRFRSDRGAGWVAWLEARWPAALGATITAVLIVAAFLHWGIPALARPIAAAVPPAVHAALGQEALETLDVQLLAPSTLPEARRSELRAAFEGLAATAGVEAVLHFRGDRGIGPNAFALPGGAVILGDALVELAGDDEEILAVLAHELGHVAGEHGMRMVVQSVGAGFVIAVLFGDVASITSFAAVLPTLLLRTGYARTLEREADAYALSLMEAVDLDPGAFARILGRLSDVTDGSGVPAFLSTHPDTDARREAAAARARAGGDPGFRRR